MKKMWSIIIATSLITAASAFAQSVQIPASLLPADSKVSGKGQLTITVDGTYGGKIEYTVDVLYHPNVDAYPHGDVSLIMTFSNNPFGNDIKVIVASEGLIQLTSTHNKYLDSAFLYARGTVYSRSQKLPCYVWMMFTDNRTSSDKETPDILQVVLLDAKEQKSFSICGPVEKGTLDVNR